MSAPLVSVVLPVRDAGRYLRVAVASILGQSYSPLELIVVDNGGNGEWLRSLVPDHRLRIVECPQAGVVAAMAVGVARARGQFIARMDGDDIATPDRLCKQMAYLVDNPEVGIAGGQVRLFREQGLGGGFRTYEHWVNGLCTPRDIDREIFVESPIPNPTALFRREVYRALGGYREVGWPEDYDLFLRAHAAGVPMGKPDGVVLHWRDHEHRLTRCDARYDDNRFMQTRGYYLARGPLRRRSAIIWGAGPCGARLYDVLRANGATIDGFVDVHPRRVGGHKRGLPVWPIEQASRAGDALVIGAVRARGARERIRQHLRSNDRQEGRDFLFAA